jgi:hypothetical protein
MHSSSSAQTLLSEQLSVRGLRVDRGPGGRRTRSAMPTIATMTAHLEIRRVLGVTGHPSGVLEAN